MRSILAGVMLAARATLLTGATLPLDFGLGSGVLVVVNELPACLVAD